MTERSATPSRRTLQASSWLDALATWPGAVLAFLLLSTFACFLNLGGFGLVTMEGMVIEGGQNMLEDGQWVVPVLYGEVYTYKPAFAYWVAAAGLRLLEPDTEFLWRFPFALSGVLLGMVLLAVVGRLVSPRAGLFAGLAATINPMMAEKIRIAEFDGLLAAAVGMAVASALAAQFRGYIAPDEPLYVVGPSDFAGKHSALFVYLERGVLAFDLEGELPKWGVAMLAEPVGGMVHGDTDTWTLPPGTDAIELSVHETPRFRYRLVRLGG